MIKVLVGDLLKSNAQTLVNTVNCVGVMGKGIALEFKRSFPEMYADYVLKCKRGEVKLGEPYLYRPLLLPWVLNFPTKQHWRSLSRLEDIVNGLQYLEAHYKEWGIESLAVPPLGCGQGQLEWRVVGPTLCQYLERLDIPIELYAPHNTPHEQLNVDFLSRKSINSDVPDPEWIKPSWVALVEIISRIEKEPYHWPIGRVILHKIAYVATLEGIPTGLEHVRASFGPFAPQLKPLVSRLMNNGLIVENRIKTKRGNMFEMTVGSTYEDAKKAYSDDLKKWDIQINKVVDLFTRLTTDQAEIVATVLYTYSEISKGKDIVTEKDILNSVKEWKKRRKPQLDETEVADTIRNLASLGWMKLKSSQSLPVSDNFLFAV